MATLVEHPTSVSTPGSIWTVLADRGVRIAIVIAGLAFGVGGGLLVATSDHLVDGVASRVSGRIPLSVN